MEDSTPSGKPVSSVSKHQRSRGKTKTGPKERQRAVSVRKTDAICNHICTEIAKGLTLRAILNKEGMPALGSFFRWLDTDANLREQYARARILQAEVFADEVVDLSDEAVDKDSSAAAKVKCWARMWHAAKTNPKKYGDKAGDVNVTTAFNSVVLTEDERQKLIERQRAAEELPEG